MKSESQSGESDILITSLKNNKSLNHEDENEAHHEDEDMLIFIRCFACSFETNDAVLLRRHSIDHFDDLLDCNKCSFKTNRRKTLNHHMFKHTKTSNLYECSICDYESFSFSKLQIHKCKQEQETHRIYKCFLCKRKIFSRSNLRLHLRNHNRHILKIIKYQNSDLKFDSQEEIDDNFIKYENEEQSHSKLKLLPCPLCSYKCYEKQDLKIHILGHLNEQFTCLECDYQTHFQDTLDEHIRNEHGERYSDNEYEYDDINMSFDISHEFHSESSLKKCSKCDFKTYNEENLTKHFLEHLVILKCSKCNFKTNLNRKLKDHYQQNHPNIEKEKRTKIKIEFDPEYSELTCKRCKHVAENEEELKIHKRSHYKVEMLKCTECDFVTSKRFYNKHLITHKYIKLHRCPLCPYGSNKSAHLKRHLEIMHSNSEMLKCQHCEFETRNKWDLRCHVLSHAKKVVTCPVCGFLTKQRYYKKHLMKHSDARYFKCTLCTYEAKVISHLKTHISLVHPEAQWFNCEKCKFQTLNENELKSHFTLKHSKMKCAECNYETNNRTRFRSHLLTHSRRFECSKCDYHSNHRGHLNMHLRTHATPRILKCPTCNYSSSQRSHMTRHLRIHSVLKLVKCQQCDFRTKSKEYLKAHMLTHIEPKMLKCDECPYGTNRKHLLKRHTLTHSKVKKA